MDLYEYFVANADAKRTILKNPHYFPIYERYFRKFVGHPITMLEIGTGAGGASQMWKYYFGPSARIVTIDIEDKRDVEQDQVFFRRGSQSDPVFLKSLVQEFGAFDIVLDDGSHMMGDINVSFDVLFALMSRSGVYLVEDLDGAYWPERDGGLGNPHSFIERAKVLIDDMNHMFVRDGGVDAERGKDIVSVSFYQMIVVIERLAYLNRRMVRMPGHLPG